MEKRKRQIFDTKSFIEFSNKIHANKFDYSRFEYKNAKTASYIICPIHGEFLQKPDHHTRKNSIGCPACVLARKIYLFSNPKNRGTRAVVSFDEFLTRATQKYGKKFTYCEDGYSGLGGNKIKIYCPIHGEFFLKPCNHLLSETGCGKCGKDKKNISKTHSYDLCVKQMNSKHNNKYIYPSYNRNFYINKKSKIDIICPIHGLFQLTSQKHLSKSGCFKCAMQALIDSGKLPGGYTIDLIEKSPEFTNQIADLYYLEIDSREFKIGISLNLNNRIKALKSKSKKNITLKYSFKMSLKNAILKERDILDIFKEKRCYKSYSTELFSEDISIDDRFWGIINKDEII